MRYIIFVWLAAAASVHGQERIFVVTRTGGVLNGGTILSFDPQGENVTVDLNFGMHFGGSRHINVKGTDGFLYGIGSGGNGMGGIFKIRTDGTGYEQIFDFEIGESDGSLAISPEGIIYGATYTKGENGGGVIFSLNQDGTKYQVLYNFHGIISMAPQQPSTIIVGSDGWLYGTRDLGSGYLGNVYAINKDGSGFKEVLNFTSVDMETPYGLFQGTGGKLYGLSKGSGSASPTLFRVNTDGSNFEAIRQFPYPDDPAYGIYQGTNGKIYGTLTNNNGVIFSCSPDGSNYQVVHTFDGTDGAKLSGAVVQASDGFLYGRATLGGVNGLGTVFRLQPDGSAFEVLTHSSIGETSSIPYVDESGDFYGFTAGGGQYGKGTLYKISSGVEQILYNFGSTDSTAFFPYEGLTNVDGTLVALCVPRSLDKPWVPTVVSLKPDQSHMTYSLPDITRSSGISRPVKGPDGFLYATTGHSGGNSLSGLLFKTKADGSSYKALHHFESASGAYPFGEILFGLDGRLYGTSFHGGNYTYGVIYAVKTDGTGYTVLHHFNYPTGEYPVAGLIQGSDGTIYGTANNVFSIRPDGTAYKQLHDFQYNLGLNGELALVGKYLYGTTSFGGSVNKGALFRVKTDGSDYSIVHNFNGDDGERPYSGVLPYAGALYGATSAGGAFGFGTIYKLNASGEGFTKVMDLNHSMGGGASGDLTGACVPAPMPLITINNTILTSSAPIGNQWYKNGILIPGAQEQSYETVISGVYTVSANLSDCPGALSDGVLINITGTENENHEGPVQFYPNPTNDHVFLKISEGHHTITSIAMFDTMGKMIYKREGRIDRDWAYDMSKHNSGVYHIQILSNEGLTHSKIIKN
jgi:uncharacterized repeat protein (TIGR03803 family)